MKRFGYDFKLTTARTAMHALANTSVKGSEMTCIERKNVNGTLYFMTRKDSEEVLEKFLAESGGVSSKRAAYATQGKEPSLRSEVNRHKNKFTWGEKVMGKRMAGKAGQTIMMLAAQ